MIKFFITLSVYFVSAAYSSSYSDQINKLLSNLKKDDLSISIVDLKQKNPIFLASPDKQLVPASIIKILSSAYFIETLGPDYQFTTDLLSTSKDIQEGNLNSSLYIKGSGDPYFVTEDLFVVTQELRLKGIKKITGDLVLDTSFFESPRIEINESSDHSSRAYSAKLSALSLNFNSFRILAQKKAGKCSYSIDPVDSGYIKVGSINNSSDLPRASLNKTGADFEEYSVSGCEGSAYSSVNNPTLYFGHVFKKFLELNGIQLQGKIVLGKTPSNTSLLYQHKSRKLSFILEGMASFSNNFMAEMILLHIGALKLGAPATMEKGINGLQKYAQDLSKDLQIRNASGLTTESRLSCQNITSLLSRIYENSLNFSSMYLSLARPKSPGTLEKRKAFFNKQIAAKTGTLTTPVLSSGLAGYLRTDSLKDVAFCIIFNKRPDISTSHQKQDEIINYIIEQY